MLNIILHFWIVVVLLWIRVNLSDIMLFFIFICVVELLIPIIKKWGERTRNKARFIELLSEGCGKRSAKTHEYFEGNGQIETQIKK